MKTDVQHLIRERAFGIWEREGRPADRAETHWFEATNQIRAEKAPRPAAAAVAKTARKTAPPVETSTAAAPRRAAPKAKAKATS